MTIEQALAQLEIAPGLPRTELRRAYLRAVKRHPPERDPDGFQRVREDFELLSNVGTFDVGTLDFEGELPAPAPDENEGEEAPEPDAPVAEEADLAELEGLPSGATPTQVLEACRAIVARAPESESLAWEVVSWLEEREHEDLAAKVVRQAHERELPGFGLYLFHRYPEHATDQLLAEASSSPEAQVRHAALGALVAQDRPTKAVKLALGLLEEAARDPNTSLYAGVYVDLLVALLASGESALASQVERAFQDYLKATASETEILQGEVAARWLLVTELGALGSKLPNNLTEALIDILRGGDPQRAFRIVNHLAQYNTGRARNVTRVLRERAPHLYALIGSPEITETSSWNTRWPLYWPLLIVALVFLRGLFTLCSSDASEKPARRTSQVVPARDVPDLVTSPNASDTLVPP